MLMKEELIWVNSEQMNSLFVSLSTEDQVLISGGSFGGPLVAALGMPTNTEPPPSQPDSNGWFDSHGNFVSAEDLVNYIKSIVGIGPILG